MQVREVSHEAGKVVTVARAESLDKPLEWAVGFFFGNTELSLGLWTVIAGTPLVPSGRGYWWGGDSNRNSSGHRNLQQTGDRFGGNTGHPTVQPVLW